VKPTTFESVVSARRDKRAVAVVTDLSSGRQTLVSAAGADGELILSPVQLARAQAMLAGEDSGLLRDEGAGTGESETLLFVHVHPPPRRLIIIGAVHIAQALAPMAQLAGYAVQVIDPRGAFATVARFPDCDLQVAWPDDVLIKQPPDSGTAVAALTHDPKIDDPALKLACPGPAFYIGALGSRRTHAKRLERLTQDGLTTDQLARIHAPIGIDIKARSPAEIAVSIMAEITTVRRTGHAGEGAAP